MPATPLSTRDQAAHPWIPARRAAELAQSGDKDVRYTLAWNRECPPAILDVLAVDSDQDVRFSTTHNPATGPQSLHALSRDPQVHTRTSVARHPRCLPATLHGLVDDVDGVRYVVAAHPACGPETLAHLAADVLWTIRRDVALHPNCPQATRDRLTRDAHLQVRLAARGVHDCSEEAYVTADTPTWNVRDIAPHTIGQCVKCSAKFRATTTPPSRRAEWEEYIAARGPTAENLAWELVVGGFDGPLSDLALILTSSLL